MILNNLLYFCSVKTHICSKVYHITCPYTVANININKVDPYHTEILINIKITETDEHKMHYDI